MRAGTEKGALALFVGMFATGVLGLFTLVNRVPEGPVQGNPAALQSGAPGYDRHNPRTIDMATSATLPQRVNLATNEITFDDMRATGLYRKPPPIFTDKVLGLDGKTAKIVAFMVPYDSLTDMRTHMLMEVSMGCYFCVPPSPKEVILVRVPGDKPLEFIEEPIVVEGTLDLWKPDSDDEAHKMFLFVINDAKISPAKDL